MRVGRSLNRRPTDLLAILAREDPCAQRRGHELRAQANAQGGLAGRQTLADAGDLVLQKRIILLAVNPDRTTKDHKEIARLRLPQGKTY
jgi:hypothetical protein